jgi:hypothetical protein
MEYQKNDYLVVTKTAIELYINEWAYAGWDSKV